MHLRSQRNNQSQSRDDILVDYARSIAHSLIVPNENQDLALMEGAFPFAYSSCRSFLSSKKQLLWYSRLVPSLDYLCLKCGRCLAQTFPFVAGLPTLPGNSRIQHGLRHSEVVRFLLLKWCDLAHLSGLFADNPQPFHESQKAERAQRCGVRNWPW